MARALQVPMGNGVLPPPDGDAPAEKAGYIFIF